MLNPSNIKGISIFMALARRLPSYEFAAAPAWATTRADLEELERQPNVTVLRPNEDVNELLETARLLLIPSLWWEALGLTTIHAMLLGMPVVASDSGGLPEAKLGVDYVLPVHQVTEYRDELDDAGIPIVEVPSQDDVIDTWVETVSRLMEDSDHYKEIAAASRTAAAAYARRAQPEALIPIVEAAARRTRQPV
jgi:glycosyltransferase involved in cell wall biosynthesis